MHFYISLPLLPFTLCFWIAISTTKKCSCFNRENEIWKGCLINKLTGELFEADVARLIDMEHEAELAGREPRNVLPMAVSA